MFKDIEYEKDGVRKFAQERFKAELEAVGWSVVAQEDEAVKPSRGRRKKQDKED
jgi:hypothetical protein